MLSMPRVASLLLAFAQTSAGPSPVQSSIAQFEKTTKIDVVDFSERELAVQLPSVVQQMQLGGPAGTTGGVNTTYQRFLTESVTLSYLYWSRDQAGADVTRLGETTVLPARFQAFLKQHQPLRGRPAGRLDVTSEPTDGTITVDGTLKGRTQNVVIVSVGKHDVIVGPPGKQPCTHTVQISAGEVVTVNCK